MVTHTSSCAAITFRSLSWLYRVVKASDHCLTATYSRDIIYVVYNTVYYLRASEKGLKATIRRYNTTIDPDASTEQSAGLWATLSPRERLILLRSGSRPTMTSTDRAKAIAALRRAASQS